MRRGGSAVRRSGGLLLETLVAVAIFVGVATFSLAAVRDGIVAAERARLRLVAVGLATSRIAEVEAGIVSPWSVGESDVVDDDAGFDAEDSSLQIEMETSPSEFEGLVRVEVSVYEREPDASTATSPRRLARLVSLVPDIVFAEGEDAGEVEREPASPASTTEVRP